MPDLTAIFQHAPSPSAPTRREWEPGRQPDAVYASELAPYRDACRRWLVGRLARESTWIAGRQRAWRSEGRDRYFYWSSLFGTHTFFMTFLPLFFFLGYPLKGRGLLHVVGLGIYVSCVAKDFACTPRPYSPPVTRLTISTHHHEYGFPSSHSTNSVSMALYLGAWLYEARARVGLPLVYAGWAFLGVYAASVVGGRVYTGMHSIADIVGGSLMGVACWLVWVLVGDASEAWVDSGSVLVPIITIPLTLALVHIHPEPVDDCPCFEDAIAILSVILGSFLGHWYLATHAHAAAYSRPLFVDGVVVGLVVLAAKVALGIATMFAWRLVMKATLLRVLPPVFRVVSGVFHVELPTRRHYTAATDYADVPLMPMRPIPSFIALHEASTETSTPSSSSPETLSPAAALSPSASPHAARSPSPLAIPAPADGLRRRRADGRAGAGLGADTDKPSVRRGRKPQRERYDAEVLTKFGVYTGMGVLATTILPFVFERLERGLPRWA
ncbi:Long-chain base-1-phosphate phosphatase [Cryptotrichosporon argae]